MHENKQFEYAKAETEVASFLQGRNFLPCQYHNMIYSSLGLEERHRLRNNISLLQNNRRRGSAVGMATGYGLDDRGDGVRVPVEPRIFTSPSRRALGLTQPHIQLVLGTLSAGVKRPGRECDQ
jgi:hypothetical protein